MPRPIRAAAASFIVTLVVFGVLGCMAAAAHAQGSGILPNQVVIGTPAGPTVFDLGNLTMPAAIVLVAWMYRDRAPFKIAPVIHLYKHSHDDVGRCSHACPGGHDAG